MGDLHFSSWPKGLPRSLAPPETTLWDNLRISALRFPEKAAILYYGTPVSYSALAAAAERLAGYLAGDLGLEPCGRVLLYMQNAPQWVIGYFAILRAGGVVVPVNPMSREDELRHVAEDSGARVAVCGEELLANVRPLLGGKPLRHAIVATYTDYLREPPNVALPDVLREPRGECAGDGVVHWGKAMEAARPAPPRPPGPDDWCVIPYSSGTTGAPKGCLHTHRTAMANVFANVNWNPAPPESVWLASLPLFHATGMQNAMNLPIWHGAAIVLMTRWDVRAAVALIERHRVSHWRLIAAMAVDLVSHLETSPADLSSLAVIGGGGAQVPRAVAEKLKRLTGLDYIEAYGLSETIAATHANPPHRPKAQCLGIPMFGVDSRVVDPGTLAELGPNETGEIVISAPQLFLGYWNRPEATAEVCFERDGRRFLRTGDLGCYDEEGYFFLLDRLKRMINVSGYKVWPAEVEALMHAHPQIKEVCVVGAPDAKRGETVKAIVVPKDPARPPSGQEIIAWCRQHMAVYKAPTDVAFVSSLPKSAAGKLLWRVLQDEERGRSPRARSVALEASPGRIDPGQ